jgi:O-antigen biosynthesis protein
VFTLPEENRREHYRRLLKDEQIELVNAHYSLFGAEVAAEEKVPFVQTIHNTYVVLSPQGIADYRAGDAFTSAYVCVSQTVAQYSDVKLGLPASKMLVVPNGIDLAPLQAAAAENARQALRQELSLADADFVFLNVGSIQAMKCQAALVRAFAGVVGAIPEAKLILVGDSCAWDPSYLHRVKRTVAEHGLEKAVLLVGRRDDARRFYHAADAFVLPSLFEGASLALDEAIAAGLPVAATGVGSAPDLLPQVGGRLVRPPFGDITNLDYTNLNAYATRESAEFVDELATAMMHLAQHRTRPLVPQALRRSLDYREAYKPYAYLFQWLLQGGHPGAARPWSVERLAAPTEVPETEIAAA